MPRTAKKTKSQSTTDSTSSRIALYMRVSSQEQATEGTSLEVQQEQLSMYCRSQGWEIYREYTDPGYTGKNGDRPGLQRLLAEAKLGLFKKVIVFKLDRLARKLRLLLELEEQMKECGVSLHSMKESIDTSTAIGRTVFHMFGLVAEWERETIVERTRSGRLQRYKQGCWAAGRPLYGYVYNKKTKKLDIDKSKAPVIRRIFQEYADGQSLAQVAQSLNKDGIPRRGSAKPWDSAAVRDVVFNPAYKGSLIVNRHEHVANLHKQDLSDAITLQIPAIVSESLWKRAEKHRNANKHLRPVRKREPRLLQGLVNCGLCGHVYSVFNYHSGQRAVYMCRGRMARTHLDGSPRCTCPTLDAECLEQQVWQRITAILEDPNRLEPMLTDTIDRLKNREAELSALIRPIDDQIAKITEQKNRLADDWVKLNMDADRFKKLQQDLEHEENRLRSIRTEIDPNQLTELEQTRAMLSFWETQAKAMLWNTVDEDGHMVKNVDSPHQSILKIVGLDDQDTGKAMHFPATKKELLNRLGVRLVVFPDRVEVKAVFDIEPIEGSMCNSTRVIFKRRLHDLSLRAIRLRRRHGNLLVCPATPPPDCFVVRLWRTPRNDTEAGAIRTRSR